MFSLRRSVVILPILPHNQEPTSCLVPPCRVRNFKTSCRSVLITKEGKKARRAARSHQADKWQSQIRSFVH